MTVEEPFLNRVQKCCLEFEPRAFYTKIRQAPSFINYFKFNLCTGLGNVNNKVK